MRALRGEEGSALVESAIVFPCLVLILYWSIALTDVLVLKLKASEAARYALWETTVWKSPAQIGREVQARFEDLRSPEGIRNRYTGLLMYPMASNLLWQARVDTDRSEVTLSGNAIRISGGPGRINGFIDTVARWIASGVQTAMRNQRFNTFGKAAVRVRLLHARHDEVESKILKGGDLPGLRGGNDLRTPRSMVDLTFDAPLPSERPMSIVFDTWKAWPKPPAYTLDGAPTDVNVSPQQTYPEVEKQVEAQVDKIAFFGMRRFSWFTQLDTLVGRIFSGGITQSLLGGKPPTIFSTRRMDSPQRGPITIRPVEPPQAGFVPNLCDSPGGRQQPCTAQGQGAQRAGDVQANSAQRLIGLDAYTDGEDVTRSTVPYRINTQYWRDSGGTASGFDLRLTPLPARIAANNQYVQAWRCRGYFFAGSTLPQEQDVARRYRPPCR